jgi:hypothetical protein
MRRRELGDERDDATRAQKNEKPSLVSRKLYNKRKTLNLCKFSTRIAMRMHIDRPTTSQRAAQLGCYTMINNKFCEFPISFSLNLVVERTQVLPQRRQKKMDEGRNSKSAAATKTHGACTLVLIIDTVKAPILEKWLLSSDKVLR